MFDKFEKTFVINLPQRVDRRRETELELAEVGAPRVEFFAAIRPPGPEKFGSVGEHGAFMSHLAVLRRAQGLKNVLILEDDVSFSEQYVEKSKLFDSLPLDWDVFYGGYDQLPNHRGKLSGAGLVEVDGMAEFVGLHFYAVNGPAISKLVKAYEVFLARERGHPEGGPMPVDGALNIARRQMTLRTFIAIPPLAIQRPSRTDIGETKWFDNIGALRPVTQFARKLKRKLKRLS